MPQAGTSQKLPPKRTKRKGQEREGLQRDRECLNNHTRDMRHDFVKPKSNSILDILASSSGAFGRFFRKMHGKSSHDLGHRTSSSPGKTAGLFQSRLVVPDSVVAANDSSNRTGGRGQDLSWRWTQMLWCLFTFLDGGCPTSERDQIGLARQAFMNPWTDQHESQAGCLHGEIIRFVKLRCPETLSRGTKQLSEIFHKIRPHDSCYDHHPPFNLDELMNNATFVKPDRMSLPSQAGILDPKDFLKGTHRKLFMNMHEWAPHDEAPCKPTKAVFKVLPDDKDAVFEKLLASGVACLLPVDRALRDAEGNVISGGLFAVPHKADSDCVILDRRPQNELERRFVMAELPHGSLLTQLIIPKGYSIRGSGDDLSNFFYLLYYTIRNGLVGTASENLLIVRISRNGVGKQARSI